MQAWRAANCTPWLYSASLAAGLLFGVPYICDGTATLQLVALTSFFLVLRRSAQDGLRVNACCGSYFGLGFVLCAVSRGGIPPGIILVLLVGSVLLWAGAALAWRALTRRQAGPWVQATLILLLDMAMRLLPGFGAGQSIACPWADFPAWLTPIGWLSLNSLVFMIAIISAFAAQAIAAQAIAATTERRRSIACLAALLLLWMALIPLARPAEDQHPPERIALAILAGGPSGAASGLEQVHSSLLPLLQKAQAAQSQTFILPEIALLAQTTDPAPGRELARLARQHHLTLITGVLEITPDQLEVNAAWAFGQDGSMQRHVKAQHIPFMEHYAERGPSGTLCPRLAQHSLGLLICQDDNFPSHARTLARQGAALLCIPTFDWPPIARAHERSFRLRALECRRPAARAAIGGYSEIISAAGTIVCRSYDDGQDSLLLGSVPSCRAFPLGAWIGDWPWCLAALLALAWALRPPRLPPPVSGSATDPQKPLF